MNKLLTFVTLLSLSSSQLVQPARANEIDSPTVTEQPILLAQACTTCGAEISTEAALGAAITGKNNKTSSLLTDSLWGNLILEMAYQRDSELSLLMHKVNTVNNATLLAIGGVTAGTLAQGITALTTLNPPNGKPDSYLPGSLGVAFSCATIVTFAARTYFGHKFQQHIHNRQLELKQKTEAVLSHLEHCNGTCRQAQDQLRSLIGERASNEWLQLWRSSHQLASEKQPTITTLPQEQTLSEMLSDAGQAQRSPLNLSDKARLFVMQQCRTRDAAPKACTVSPIDSKAVDLSTVPDLVH